MHVVGLQPGTGPDVKGGTGSVVDRLFVLGEGPFSIVRAKLKLRLGGSQSKQPQVLGLLLGVRNLYKSINIPSKELSILRPHSLTTPKQQQKTKHIPFDF